jgi:hypothetical protein
MKFMMLVIPAEGYNVLPAGTLPDEAAMAAMSKYNDELAKAGVLVSLNGLHPPSMGARVTFPGGKPKVQDGPFTEAKEMLGGYWLIDVASRDKAIEWACKIPPVEDFTIEVRQVQEPECFKGMQPDDSTYNEFNRKERPVA